MVSLLCIYFIYLLGNTKKTPINHIYKQVIPLVDMPEEDSGSGGIIVADLNGDGKMDFIVTKPGFVGAWDNTGLKLWSLEKDIQITQQAEINGLPGWNAPGVQVGDIDENGRPEVLFLTKSSHLVVADGATGTINHSIELKPPKDIDRWEHLVISNFQGSGENDLFLQATGNETYKMGRYIAAYTWTSLLNVSPQPLWMRNDFIANPHSGARIVDIDGDGKDEVLGETIVGHNGNILYQLPFKGHLDSIFAADVRPDLPGLEVVALEEGGGWVPFSGKNIISYYINKVFNRLFGGGNHVSLSNINGVIWKVHYNHSEPQNAAVGDFDISKEGLEIWCRSRYNTHQKPFVFDSRGKFVSTYNMVNVSPEGWTAKGVEVISPIQWTGDNKQLCTAKERHTSGKVGIFDALNGEFVEIINEKSDRLYVADVYDDWREELIVLSGSQLHIYINKNKNPFPDRPSLWKRKDYRRSKMTWNYYNP